jgi:glycosyltransferase involved in cell wall biosynthesis
LALITFETSAYRLDPDETTLEKERLRIEGIDWHPVIWDGGTSLGSKIGGIFRVLATGFGVCRRSRPVLIHSRSSLPAFMAVTLKKLFRTKYLYDADSLLSEEYADIGHLKRQSFGFKFLAWGERLARENADQIIVLTDTLKSDYTEKLGISLDIEVIPCCIDTDLFIPNDQVREKRRSELGLINEKLFVYVGKSGSWYMIDETFRFFRSFKRGEPTCRLLIITPDAHDVFYKAASAEGVPNDALFIRSAKRDEVREWLTAADVGLSLIKQLPSKRGSSPVKFSEYLSVGLPVVVTDGIGDCSRIILENEVGVVLQSVSDDDMNKGVGKLGNLLSIDQSEIVKRCRTTAQSEFDLERVGVERYRNLYSRLFVDGK